MTRPAQNTALFSTEVVHNSTEPTDRTSISFDHTPQLGETPKPAIPNPTHDINSADAIKSTHADLGESRDRLAFAPLIMRYADNPAEVPSRIRGRVEGHLQKKGVPLNTASSIADEAIRLRSTGEQYREFAELNWEQYGKPLGRIAVNAVNTLAGRGPSENLDQELSLDNFEGQHFPIK